MPERGGEGEKNNAAVCNIIIMAHSLLLFKNIGKGSQRKKKTLALERLPAPTCFLRL